MSYQRVLTVQDISCVGQCSLTVALPILSACGLETCILPSAVLSTHTGGFTGYTFRDLTEDMPAIEAHWVKEGIRFDAVYTGYLGSAKQVDYVKSMLRSLSKPGCVAVVDPAMADNGKLYAGFDDAFVDCMRTLVQEADYLLPNITEAALLAGMEYREAYDEAYADALAEKLLAMGAKNLILTGVSFRPDTTGVLVFEKGGRKYYEHRRISQGFHGTGDVYASAFVGALLRGKSAYDAASIAADYVVQCIEFTRQLPDHWYGVAFEPVLPELMKQL